MAKKYTSPELSDQEKCQLAEVAEDEEQALQMRADMGNLTAIKMLLELKRRKEIEEFQLQLLNGEI